MSVKPEAASASSIYEHIRKPSRAIIAVCCIPISGVVLGPVPVVTVPARHYCLVRHPVAPDARGDIERDAAGQAWLRHGDLEVRLAQEPFPLHPGEELEQDVTPLRVVLADTALRLRALLDFEDEDGARRVAGDEWLFEGPGTYIPRKEVEVTETLQATVIGPNQAVRLRARKECTDREGTRRVTGAVTIGAGPCPIAPPPPAPQEAELARRERAQEQELRAQRARAEAEAAHALAMAEVEGRRVRDVAAALGPDVIRDIARAGPELQVQLLRGLGLQSALITDGAAPLNLFTTARGLLGLAPPPGPAPVSGSAP
ncbi:major vault protein [Eudromia elegans]